jgi:hypothetical protein
MKTRNLTKTTLLLAAVAVLASQPLQAAVTFDDFSTNPNISTEWTQYSYFGSENTTPTWNSIDQDLDLDGGGGGGAVMGLYRTGSSRSASDPVTLTVADFNVAGGSWHQVGLMIGDTAQPGLLDSNEKYEWAVRWEGGTYKLRVRKDVGTGSFNLFNEDIGGTFAGPTKLDIVRTGDDYQFLANDVLKYTASSYSSAVHDTFVNYQITKGGDGSGTATVDDFGVIPEPSAVALFGLAGLGLFLRRRR